MSKISNFRYAKESLFEEFKVAQSKDEKLKGRQYKHRLALCQEHLEHSKTNPEWYDMVDINWENLVKAYSAPDPRDHFYMTVFGKTYSEKMAESALEKDYGDNA